VRPKSSSKVGGATSTWDFLSGIVFIATAMCCRIVAVTRCECDRNV
jgi:hypothetical protein